MANSFHRIRKGISLTPTVLPVSGEVGDILCDIADNEIKRWDGLSWVKVGSGGGVVVVADTTERNNIPEDERTDCMLVGVVGNDTIYKLIGQPTGATTTSADWDPVITSANIATITNKDIDGGTASNTSRLTVPRAATIEAAAALARKKATLLYNDFTNKFLKDNGTDLKSIPDFGDVNIFAQEIAADNVIGSWTQNLSGITATFTKGTDSRLGTCYKLDITSASSGTGGTYTVRKDFAVPEAFRGTFVELSYDYVSTVSKTGTYVILYDVTNSVAIVPQTEIQSQPDPTSLTTKGFITFSIPSTCATLRVFIGRAVDASAIAISNQYFYFNNLQFKKYQMLINPIRPAIGTIQEFAGPVANIPYGFLNCDGAAVSRSTYAKLFAVIGTTYGTGDGSTTFNLPNTQGIGLRGVGTQTFGSKTYTATLGQKRNDNIAAQSGSVNIPNGQSTSQPTYYNATGIVSVSGNSTYVGNAAGTGAGGRVNISFGSGTETNGADLAVNYMICFDDGPARYADYTLNQDVSFQGYVSATQSLTANTTNINLTSLKDTTGAWTGSTFVVPSAGDYVSEGSLLKNTADVRLLAYVNGVLRSDSAHASGTNTPMGIACTLRDLKVNDVITLRTHINASVSVSTTNLITIRKIATSQQLFTPIAQRYVVKTYQSGSSWYEVNNDGWVRQGLSTPIVADTTFTTTWLIAFSDNNYLFSRGVVCTSLGISSPKNSTLLTKTATAVTAQVTTNVTSSYIVAEGFGDSAAVKALGSNPNY